MLARVLNEPETARDADLFVDGVQVILGRRFGDEEARGDLAVP